MHTVSPQCQHRFCKRCLGMYLKLKINEGKVKQIFCPFDPDSAMEEVDNFWVCPTCSMQNAETRSACVACEVPKDKWVCPHCTVWNDRTPDSQPRQHVWVKHKGEGQDYYVSMQTGEMVWSLPDGSKSMDNSYQITSSDPMYFINNDGT